MGRKLCRTDGMENDRSDVKVKWGAGSIVLDANAHANVEKEEKKKRKREAGQREGRGVENHTRNI